MSQTGLVDSEARPVFGIVDISHVQTGKNQRVVWAPLGSTGAVVGDSHSVPYTL